MQKIFKNRDRFLRSAAIGARVERKDQLDAIRSMSERSLSESLLAKHLRCGS